MKSISEMFIYHCMAGVWKGGDRMGSNNILGEKFSTLQLSFPCFPQDCVSLSWRTEQGLMRPSQRSIDGVSV